MISSPPIRLLHLWSWQCSGLGSAQWKIFGFDHEDQALRQTLGAPSLSLEKVVQGEGKKTKEFISVQKNNGVSE